MIAKTAAVAQTRRVLLKALTLGAAAPAVARFSPARAAWPADKPIKIVAPFAPGGPADVIARIVAQGLGEQMPGATVVVENKAGAGGNIGTGQVARSEPDGTNLLVTSSAFMLNPSLYETVTYDPYKDFAPVSLMVSSPNVFLADARSGIKTLAELIARAKADPDKLIYTSSGTGTTPQLAYELLKIRAGFKSPHMAVAGAGPAVQALLAATVPVGSVALPTAHPHIKSGALNGLAITAAKRWPDLPDVPTMREAGFEDFLLDTKIIMVAPIKTPPEIVERLSKEIAAYLAKPATHELVQKNGYDVLAEGPAGLRAVIEREVPMWKSVVEQAGIKMR